MTQRKEAQEEARQRHHFWALVFTILAIAVIAGFGIFIAVQATHLPHTVAIEADVSGASYRTVETEWDHLVIEHTGDLEMGDMRWEVTRDPGNETLKDGMQGEDDHALITVRDLGPGEYGVFLEPTGVNSAKEYDVTIREFYLLPATMDTAKWTGLALLFLLAVVLWYVALSKATEKVREEYRLARIALALALVLSAAVGFMPWY